MSNPKSDPTLNNAPNWRAQLRYRFENTLSKGPGLMIAYLALASSFVVLLAGPALSWWYFAFPAVLRQTLKTSAFLKGFGTA